MRPDQFQEFCRRLDGVLKDTKRSHDNFRKECAQLRQQRRDLRLRLARFLLLRVQPPEDLAGLILALKSEEEERQRKNGLTAPFPRRTVPRGAKESPVPTPLAFPAPQARSPTPDAHRVPASIDPSQLILDIREAILSGVITTNRWNGRCYVLPEVTYLATPNAFKSLIEKGLYPVDSAQSSLFLDALASLPYVLKQPDGKIVRAIAHRTGARPFHVVAIETRALFEDSELARARVGTWPRPIRELTDLDVQAGNPNPKAVSGPAPLPQARDPRACPQDRRIALQSLLERMIDRHLILPARGTQRGVLKSIRGKHRSLARQAIRLLEGARVLSRSSHASTVRIAIEPLFLPAIRTFLNGGPLNVPAVDDWIGVKLGPVKEPTENGPDAPPISADHEEEGGRVAG